MAEGAAAMPGKETESPLAGTPEPPIASAAQGEAGLMDEHTNGGDDTPATAPRKEPLTSPPPTTVESSASAAPQDLDPLLPVPPNKSVDEDTICSMDVAPGSPNDLRDTDPSPDFDAAPPCPSAPADLDPALREEVLHAAESEDQKKPMAPLGPGSMSEGTTRSMDVAPGSSKNLADTDPSPDFDAAPPSPSAPADLDPALREEVLHAAESGDHKKLTTLLEANPEAVHATNDEGQTPLHLVVKDCYVICCRQLVKARALLDAQDHKGQTPLHLAIFHGSLDVIDALLDAGASPMVTDHDGRNALHISAQMGLSRVGEVLLMDMDFEEEANAEEEDEEGEHCPKCWQAQSIIEDEDLLMKCDHPFHNSTTTMKRDPTCHRLPVDKVGLLRGQDKDGNTPLHLIAGEPDYQSLVLEFCGVLREEAPEDCLRVVSMLNHEGLQALHLAAVAGCAEAIGELLEIGSDPWLKTPEGENSFHLAVMSCHYPAVWQFLQLMGAMGERWAEFLNERDGAGNTVMHLACKYGHDRAAFEFLRHRVMLDVNAKNAAGETPAVIAYKEGFDYLVRTLLANGCSAEEVELARADDAAKGIVRKVKLNVCGIGPEAQALQGLSWTPVICFIVLLIFLGPYFFSFIERFM